ncbi:aminoglycoside adenylyltransferase domain-containing protein [Psychrobacillus vulpis]|uniref:Spectinomycin 9-adenylyltransferase n=1 Tax=Psychrobacillus vulpis TaxID=2325572 RepID=A0A544TNY4_9BACI|nr:aminoglycoside adenylyltransferase domain-containing protein [Psychrobacillus vulpis]TQR19109.1 DUF4111 domain-containing protein [Psychrobacillus vulpis]
MDVQWSNASPDIQRFVYELLDKTKEIIGEELEGFYIHGSLAMGGFKRKSSDIDILVITTTPLTMESKKIFAKLFLEYSNQPFPVEVSFLNIEQLKFWKHPSPFDFHYSELWIKRYEDELSVGITSCLNWEDMTDPDIAAHLTITYHRGICLFGKPIKVVFPLIPKAHYISSIISDFEDCLENIERDPIYCTLNLIRVFWFLKEGIICSKQEAAIWGLANLPKKFNSIIEQIVNGFETNEHQYAFEKKELLTMRDYIKREVEGLLK